MLYVLGSKCVAQPAPHLPQGADLVLRALAVFNVIKLRHHVEVLPTLARQYLPLAAPATAGQQAAPPIRKAKQRCLTEAAHVCSCSAVHVGTPRRGSALCFTHDSHASPPCLCMWLPCMRVKAWQHHRCLGERSSNSTTAHLLGGR